MEQQPETDFIRRVMPHASEDEITAATERWLSFLKTIGQISERLERERSDSAETSSDGRVD